MTLPASGPLSLAQIAGEFGGAVPHALSEYYGAAAGIPASGAISIGQFYGKASTFTLTIASNVANPNIPSLASAAGWNGSARLVVNITAALVNTIDLLSSWSFPGGLEINISAATRVGGYRKAQGVRGGTAFKTAVPVVLNNLGTLSGCGGSGGGGDTWVYVDYKTTADRVYGSGGNPGLGQGFANASATTVSAATSGEVGVKNTFTGAVFGGDVRPWAQNGNGGAGGAWGTNGGSGTAGAVGGTYVTTGKSTSWAVGAPGGYAVEGNALITWTNNGTRVGGVV